jgi:hypothetical protein
MFLAAPQLADSGSFYEINWDGLRSISSLYVQCRSAIIGLEEELEKPEIKGENRQALRGLIYRD